MLVNTLLLCYSVTLYAVRSVFCAILPNVSKYRKVHIPGTRKYIVCERVQTSIQISIMRKRIVSIIICVTILGPLCEKLAFRLFSLRNGTLHTPYDTSIQTHVEFNYSLSAKGMKREGRYIE